MGTLITKNNDALEILVDLYPHQERELREHWDDEARALPWGMRTGKSMVPTVSASNLWQYGRLDGLIIIAPSKVHHAWVKHEFENHCAVPFNGYSWNCKRDSTEKEKRRLEKFLDSAKTLEALNILSINKEALLVKRVWNVIRRFVKKYRCMLIVDEAHHYGRAGCSGTKRVRALAKRCPYRRTLTGTTVGNSPGRVYSQYQILEEGALGYKTHAEFLQAHGTFIFDGRHWVQDKKTWRDIELLRARMAEWGRPVLRSDCEDLPPVITTPYYIDLDGGLWGCYQQAMIESKLTDPPNFFPARRLAMVPKASILAELMPTFLKKGPVVVWAPFTDIVDEVASVLRERGFLAAAHHGKLSDTNRERVLRSVERVGGILVSTPDSLKEGMDLSWARTIVWYAPPWDSIIYDQARERCTAMGGHSTDEILLISNDTIEEGMYGCLEKKMSVADWLGGTGLRDWMAEHDA